MNGKPHIQSQGGRIHWCTMAVRVSWTLLAIYAPIAAVELTRFFGKRIERELLMRLGLGIVIVVLPVLARVGLRLGRHLNSQPRRPSRPRSETT